jgi:glucokinase
MRHFISGDIGGTKTRLALVAVEGTRVSIVHEHTYPSREFADFADVLANFARQVTLPEAAAFGVAGQIHGRVARTTNLDWVIDAAALEARFGLRRVGLLNDLEATAWGIAALDERDVLTLHAGQAGAQGNCAVIAAGTGLGEAGLYWDGRQHRPYATEGGHVSFSPASADEFALLNYLQARHGHVSWERVVSGMGIVNLHAFLREHHGTPAPVWLAEKFSQGDAAAAISAAALAGRDAICVETMQWFVRLYGAEAGNLALKSMSRGGIYVGGGIAPKILPLLQSGAFMAAFLNKGRMRPLLEAMPVKIILNDRTALFGPALFAANS